MATVEMKGDQVIIADGQWGTCLFCCRQAALYPSASPAGCPFNVHRALQDDIGFPLCLEAPQASGNAPVQDTFGAAIHASK